MMMIMKHVNLSVQRNISKYPDKDEVNKAKIEKKKTAVQCETSHREKLQPIPKHPRTDAVVQQKQADGKAIRKRQLPRTSRTRQPRSRASAQTWHPSADSQCKRLNSCRRKIDTQDINIVVAALTTGIVSRRPSHSSSRQHSMMSNLFRVKQIMIGVNKIDSDPAGSKRENCGEISNEMKSMLTKICWKKDFIEKNIQDLQPAEAVGATKCSQNSEQG